MLWATTINLHKVSEGLNVYMLTYVDTSWVYCCPRIPGNLISVLKEDVCRQNNYVTQTTI